MLGSERLQHMMMTHDDFNYTNYNKEIFTAELPITERSID